MKEIETIVSEASSKLGVKILFCKKQSELTETVMKKAEEEGKTLFKFFFRGQSYVGALEGVGKTETNYALLLPPYIEAHGLTSGEISKTEFLKRILLGECPFSEIQKYMMKYAVKDTPCFVIALSTDKQTDEMLSLAAQYGGNSADTAVKLDAKHFALVKFVGEEENEYRSATDYADFLVQSLREELGVEVAAGVGSTVKTLKDIALSYSQAAGALRYAAAFSTGGGVHSYKEYMLVKMLEDVSESKLSEYHEELNDENAKEIFEDEEMLATAEEFLESSLNVSETSRKLYMHRNTLLYRLDKIEKATGLNIREFPDAVSFRVLTILYKLLKK